MAKFIVTRAANEDISEILAYVSDDNFEAAIALYDRLTEIFRMLGENPMAGRERAELQEGLRSFPDASYLIFYRKWANKVAITRVLHSARDLDEIFS